MVVFDRIRVVGSTRRSIGDAGTRNGGLRRQTKPQQSGAGAPVGGGLGRCRSVRTRTGFGLGSLGIGRGLLFLPHKDFAPEVAPVAPADGLVEVQEWQDEPEDVQVLRIHDEGAGGLEDECKEECAEHRSTPPAVGASEGVAADEADADAAVATSTAAGADAATAAFSGSADSTEGSRAQDARAKPRCRYLGIRCCLAEQTCQC